MMKKDRNKFLLADDHGLIRQGLIFLLEETEIDCEIFQASNFQQILETVRTTSIDTAILDAQFPEGNILSILSEIKILRPEIKILIFSGIDENKQALKYIKAGANGFLSKMSEEDEIKIALLKMQNEGEYLSTETRKRLMSSINDRTLIDPLISLSERELEIAQMYASGLGNLEIANKLDLKQNTVSTIKKRILDKLKIQNLIELIEILRENN